ncbi:hypothetical protein G6F50_013872 [Rhizopus delemar]|uniref:Uncharacterized protein n=1 Tax=Rhizopus delemar TaxID=936053 RepID=A0A9P6YCF6_9FUNG|nr:hypothetical protein G6F50_013872 [Rhizopus delemar]
MPVRRDWRVALARSIAHLAERDANDGEFVDEAEQLVAVQSALTERCRWLKDEELRYCPACVQSGRHYQYQQDKRFVRCVLHLARLQTGCPHCSVALNTKGSLVHGFTCDACGETLLKYPIPGSLKTSASVSYARTLDELHQWLKDANASLLRYQRACSGHTSICWDGDQADSHAGTYWYALIQHPKSIVRNALAPTPASFRAFRATPLVQALPANDGTLSLPHSCNEVYGWGAHPDQLLVSRYTQTAFVLRWTGVRTMAAPAARRAASCLPSSGNEGVSRL